MWRPVIQADVVPRPAKPARQNVPGRSRDASDSEDDHAGDRARAADVVRQADLRVLHLPAPGLALTAVAGSAGDPILVGIVAGLGQAVGELTGYAAGRNGRSFLPDSPAATRIAGWLARWGMALIFVLALIPNPVFDVAGIAAGALRMPVLRYLGAAAAGKILKNIVVAGGAASLGGLLGAAGGLLPG